MDKQIERAGDDNKNNIGVLYGIGVGPGEKTYYVHSVSHDKGQGKAYYITQ